MFKNKLMIILKKIGKGYFAKAKPADSLDFFEMAFFAVILPFTLGGAGAVIVLSIFVMIISLFSKEPVLDMVLFPFLFCCIVFIITFRYFEQIEEMYKS